MVIKHHPFPTLIVDGVEYIFQDNVLKNGKRLLLYLRNPFNLHLIIRSEAYNFDGDIVSGYVGLYIRADDRFREDYTRWWKKTIQGVDV